MGKIRRNKAVVKPKKIPEVPSKEVVDDGEVKKIGLNVSDFDLPSADDERGARRRR